METTEEKTGKFVYSMTFKMLVIGFLSVLLLIPSVMIQNLILERQNRSHEAVRKMNNGWAESQTVEGPLLIIPYAVSDLVDGKVVEETHFLHLTPELLKINVGLHPKEKYVGIYKAILYKSDIVFDGNFTLKEGAFPKGAKVKWENVSVLIGISDLRGVADNLNFNFAGKNFAAQVGSGVVESSITGLTVPLSGMSPLTFSQPYTFHCQLKLKGSDSLNFIPLGKTTSVKMNGEWAAPGFTGNFSPEHAIRNQSFTADWTVLPFNRNIPENWVDKSAASFQEASFGVNLVDTVDHYQQCMRSAKYAILFIALTFLVFIFVEMLTRRRIHPVQYLLVGFALILFYSLLLSISEQLGFGGAYIISSVAVVAMIVLYVKNIFARKLHAFLLGGVLALLYAFLYVIMQLEDVALLVGSIGLFVILGVVMYFSQKINWYQPLTNDSKED